MTTQGDRRRAFERMSPFEIKDELIRLAREASRRSSRSFLDAGRANPNWLATGPREAFFLLGQFAMTESRAAPGLPDGLGGLPDGLGGLPDGLGGLPDGLGGLPCREGIAARLAAWLATGRQRPGAAWLEAMLAHVGQRFAFAPDGFVHELADAICGDAYPYPVRMLEHAEAVARAWLDVTLCGGAPPPGRFDLFATEGATAAICAVFRALRANRILGRGDAVALLSPIFAPYPELLALGEDAFEPVHLSCRPEDRFQPRPEEIARLEDPRIKALLLVNPGNPTAVALDPASRACIETLVRTRRPDLLLITDDVYCGFVEGFRSLLATLPRNTLGIYSFSKYFGCTGWRLGLVALHEDNVLDAMLAAQPEAARRAAERRYASLSPAPRALPMIERMAAESRDVALHHTGGLSGPQQAMLTLFALAGLMDADGRYHASVNALLRRRAASLMRALDIDGAPNPCFDSFYGLVDLDYWIRTHLGEEVAAWMRRNVHPLEIVFRLAEEHGIVLLNGGGFHAPDWSVRISFANLPDEAYPVIGRALRALAEEYRRACQAGDRHA